MSEANEVQVQPNGACSASTAALSIQVQTDGACSASTAALSIQMHEAILKTHEHCLNIRPSNTSRAYSIRHDEFKKWCVEKAFIDGITVTGDKLHLFLHEQVIGRSRKKRKGNGDQVLQNVGKSTVLGYTSAIVDLWRQQASMRMNSHPNPRDANVKLLLKNTEYDTQQLRKANFVDRGIGTLLDGYTTTEQMAKLADVFWTRTRDFGQNLRNLCAFLVSHYALLRGETVRNLDLADMHSVLLENEGFSVCNALVFVVRQGKRINSAVLNLGLLFAAKISEFAQWEHAHSIYSGVIS
jgi:hypothetical protein